MSNYRDLPSIVNVKAKQIIEVSKTYFGDLGCYTLSTSVKGVRFNSRGLLCIRVFINADLIGIQKDKTLMSSNGANHYEFCLVARSYLYYLATKIQLNDSKGNRRQILVPTFCRDSRCVNPSHQSALPYQSNLFELVTGQKATDTGINQRRKRITQIRVETLSHSFTSLDQLQHQKAIDDQLNDAVNVNHTVIDL